MPRHMKKHDVEAYRVIFTVVRDGVTYTETFGTYHDLKTARGIVTTYRRTLSHWYRKPTSISAVIEKSPLFWEYVETVS